jgi:hypothetical protein
MSASRKFRYWLVLAAIAIFGAILFAYPIYDSDIFWHLATGRYIASEGGIPHTDPFSWTAGGEKWTTHEWLFEMVAWFIYSAGSFASLVVFRILLMLGIILIPLLFLKDSRVSPLWLFIFGLTGILMLLARGSLRPHLLTAMFFGLYVVILEGWLRGRINSLWWLPGLMLIWANWHSGATFGILIVIYYLAWQYMANPHKIVDGKIKAHPTLKPLAICLGTVVIAALVNPNFFGMLTYPIRLSLFYNEVMLKFTVVDELQTLTFGRLPAFYLSLVFVILGIIFSAKRLDFRRLVLLIILALASIYRLRFVELYVPVFLAFTPELFQPVLDMVSRWRFGKAAIIGLSAVSLYALGFLVLYFYPGLPDFGVDESAVPNGTVDWIEENNPQGKMANSFKLGGYLIFELYPERRDFMDGRILVFRDLLTELSEGTDLLDEYEIDYVVYDLKSTAQGSLDVNEWALVSFDAASTLYIRRDGEASELVRDHEFHVLGPYDPFEVYADISEAPEYVRDSMLVEIERVLAENPSRRARAVAIGSYMMLGGDYLEVGKELLDAAMQDEPYYENYWYTLAQYYFIAGDLESAESVCRRMLLIWPQADYARLLLGKIFAAEGDNSRAMRVYRRMVFFGEDSPEVHLAMAYSLRDLGRIPEAIRAVQTYLQTETDRSSSQYESGEDLRYELRRMQQ